MLDALLKKVYRLTRDRNFFILVLACVIALSSLVYVLIDFNFRSSFLDLLPQGDPIVKEYRDRKDVLANSDHLILALSIQEEDHSPAVRKERLYSAASKLKEDLISSGEIEEVQFDSRSSLPPEYEILSSLENTGEKNIDSLLFRLEKLDYLRGNGKFKNEDYGELDLAEIYGRLRKETENLISEDEEKGKDSPQGNLKERKDKIFHLNERVLGTLEEIGLLREEKESLNEVSSTLQVTNESSNRYLSPDGEMLLLQAKPRLPSSEGVRYCRKVKNIALKEIENNRSFLEKKGIKAKLAGNYITVTENSDTLKNDMTLTTLVSSIGILIIFFLAIGSWTQSLMILFPLFVSLVFTMGWAKFSVGGFNLLTSFLPALVLGLGIDYGIHLLTRFSKNRREGESISEAIKDTILTKGKGSFLAALTTSLVFASLVFSHAEGFREMGIITSVGIMSSFLVYLFIVPSMIFLVSKWGKFPAEVGVFDYKNRLKRFINWVLERKKLLLAVILILTLIMGYQASTIDFQFSSNTISPEVESLRTLENIQNKFGSENLFGPTFLFFPESEDKMDHITNKLKEMEIVTATESVKSLIPLSFKKLKQLPDLEKEITGSIENLKMIRKNLKKKQKIIKDIGGTVGNLSMLQFSSTLSNRSITVSEINRMMEQLISIRKKISNIKTESFGKDLSSIEKDLKIISEKLRKIGPLFKGTGSLKELLDDLPTAVKSRFLTEEGEFILTAKVKPNIYNSSQLNDFVKTVSEFSDNYFGIPLINYRLEQILQRDFLISTLLAFVTISVLLLTGMGGVRKSILSALPLILGYVWMIGGMEIFGMNFNFINITISPLLIGVGIDNGIHLIHLFGEEISNKKLDDSIVSVFSNTGLAIITTSITTIVVFGSLLLSRTPGLRILGLTALMGLGFTMIFSITALPAAISLAFRDRD